MSPTPLLARTNLAHPKAFSRDTSSDTHLPNSGGKTACLLRLLYGSGEEVSGADRFGVCGPDGVAGLGSWKASGAIGGGNFEGGVGLVGTNCEGSKGKYSMQFSLLLSRPLFQELLLG